MFSLGPTVHFRSRDTSSFVGKWSQSLNLHCPYSVPQFSNQMWHVLVQNVVRICPDVLFHGSQSSKPSVWRVVFFYHQWNYWLLLLVSVVGLWKNQVVISNIYSWWRFNAQSCYGWGGKENDPVHARIGARKKVFVT